MGIVSQSVEQKNNERLVMNENDNELPATSEALRERIAGLTEFISEQARTAEQARGEMLDEHRERMQTQRERWQADADEKNSKIDALLATDAGAAWAEVEDMKRQVARAQDRAERYRGEVTQANTDRDFALLSVAGGEKIHPADPRVAHIWRKAARLANSSGHCGEYDRLTNALGLPDVLFSYSGHVRLRITAYVDVPVDGEATRLQVQDDDIEFDIDNDDILEHVDTSTLDWSIDSIDISVDDDDDDDEL